MRKLRVLCWLLSAYLLCCSAFAAPSANDFYKYDRVANMAPLMSVLSESNGYTWYISTSEPIYYGFTPSDYRVFPETSNILFSPFYMGWMELDSYIGASSTDSYIEVSSSYYIDVYTTVNLSYVDIQSIDILGSLTAQVNVGYFAVGGGIISSDYSYHANSVDLLIDGAPVGDSQSLGSVDWTYLLSKGHPTVTSIGFRFYFGPIGKNTTVPSYPGRALLFDFESELEINDFNTQQGLFASLFQWLADIRDGITGVASSIASGFGNVINAITSLPGLIVDGIRNLFIPSQQDLETLKANYETMLEEKLGFVWQVGDWLTSFANTMISAFTGGTSYTFEFPGISFSMSGETHEIVPAQTVSLENAFMSVMRPVLGTAVSFICIIAFIRLGEHMLTAVVSGASYFEFLKGDGG